MTAPIHEHSRSNGSILEGAMLTLSGRVVAVPRGPFATAIAALTGWLLIGQIVDCAARLFLAYRANAEVRVTETAIEIHEKKSLLGRQFPRTQKPGGYARC